VAWVVLALDVVFLVVTFGVRTVVQLRTTGDSGWRLAPHRGFGQAASGVLLFGALGLLVTSVVFAFLEYDGPTSTGLAAAGIAVAIIAIVGTFVAQLQMGSSWRIGVEAGERTALVTSGLYRWVRNPIYTGMVLFGIGQALMVPSVWSVSALVALAAGVQVQVRVIEEPYLVDAHGRDFVAWRAATGRFVPNLGRN
jgi:protein-S-isoprenylcysteine O-methyltransferase Ste14